jgi:hypothetical protein
MRTYVERLEGGPDTRFKSALDLLGGECSRVGGVDASDSPDEPAVDGRASTEGASFFTFDFLRAGTPSGQVHCKEQKRMR